MPVDKVAVLDAASMTCRKKAYKGVALGVHQENRVERLGAGRTRWWKRARARAWGFECVSGALRGVGGSVCGA